MTAPDTVTPELHLPASLGWYREAANWLVGLATASIVFGITNLEKFSYTPFASWLYGLMLLAFLVTTVSGIFFYFFITDYAHNYLRREKYASLYNNASATPEQKQTYEQECTVSKKKADSSAQSYAFYFRIMLPSFSIGVCLAAGLALTTLLIQEKKQTPGFKVVAIPITPLTPQGALMIDETTGKSWVLQADTTSQLRWRMVEEPVSVQTP
ncbi:hypothetical protein ACFPMF_21130 [Larkinella bovis]|uniref:Uncharacterized protein n=1 Tax=Larkinella bovis TaxID=683041 RepID=A0ABW0IHI5_9BACT